MASKSRLEQIAEFRAQLAQLEQQTTADLRARAAALEKELAGIHQEIERITGSSSKAPKATRGRKPKAAGGGIIGGGKQAKPHGGAIGNAGPRADVADANALRAILSKAEGKKLNRKGLNDAGYKLKSALTIAKADTDTFGFKQNGPQGEVWLK